MEAGGEEGEGSLWRPLNGNRKKKKKRRRLQRFKPQFFPLPVIFIFSLPPFLMWLWECHKNQECHHSGTVSAASNLGAGTESPAKVNTLGLTFFFFFKLAQTSTL